MTTNLVHFTVTGEFITDTARGLWNDEDEPSKALRILDCLPGMTYDQKLAVLEGHMKLVGDSDSGVTLEPDNFKGKTLEHVIDGFRSRLDDANEDFADLVQLQIKETVIVGSPTGAREIPLRRASPNTQGRRALKDDVDFDDLIDDPGRPLPKSGKRPTKALRVYVRRDDYGKSWDAGFRKTRDVPEPEEQKPRPPPADDKITNDTGWLSPDGKFYQCTYGQHAVTAWNLGLTNNPNNHFVDPPGWCRLAVNDSNQWFFGEDSIFTPIQLSMIEAFCVERGIELPFFIKSEVVKLEEPKEP